MDFLIVIMASGIARGRVRTRTAATTESRNMGGHSPATLIGQPRHAALVWKRTSLILNIHLIVNWHLPKYFADQYHVTISWAQVYSSSRSCVFWSWRLTKCWFSIGSRVHVRLTCWKQARIVRKPVDANPGLKVNRIITFSSIQMFFDALFRVYGDFKLKTEGQTIYRKPHRKVTKLKSKFYLFLG